jgi:hypothetical protein
MTLAKLREGGMHVENKKFIQNFVKTSEKKESFWEI